MSTDAELLEWELASYRRGYKDGVREAEARTIDRCARKVESFIGAQSLRGQCEPGDAILMRAAAAIRATKDKP
jgi:hypothetical protein